MNPGPGLDRAVAEALGFEPCQSGCWMSGDVVERMSGDVEIKTIPHLDRAKRNWSLVSRVPSFSTDNNDAMIAAEKAGLWTDHFLKGDEIWTWTACFQSHAGCNGNVHPIISGESPAHAICLAILTLKGKPWPTSAPQPATSAPA